MTGTRDRRSLGRHDYIAYKGIDRAPPTKVIWIKQNLIAYFIGTEAPDTNKKIPGVTEGGRPRQPPVSLRLV